MGDKLKSFRTNDFGTFAKDFTQIVAKLLKTFQTKRSKTQAQTFEILSLTSKIYFIYLFAKNSVHSPCTKAQMKLLCTGHADNFIYFDFFSILPRVPPLLFCKTHFYAQSQNSPRWEQIHVVKNNYYTVCCKKSVHFGFCSSQFSVHIYLFFRKPRSAHSFCILLLIVD